MRDYSDNIDAIFNSPVKVPNSGGGGDDKTYSPPSNYKPSTSDQRTRWNKFLDYLSTKGIGGSKDLDVRDKSLGLNYLKEYNKANPKDAVDEGFIPTAQYENYLIRRKNSFPGLNEKQNKDAFYGLSEAYKTKNISPVDSWLGSATSRQYYPTFQLASATGTKDFGTSFEDFLKSIQ
jgi:hypothetical protein